MGVIPTPRPEVGAISGNLVVEQVGASTVWCRCICGRENHRRVSHDKLQGDDWRTENVRGCLSCHKVVGTKARNAGWFHGGSLRAVEVKVDE